MTEFNYLLEEHGWAQIEANLGSSRFLFRVSYMSDALDDLVSATIAVASGSSIARFALIDEPGSYCWVLVQR